MTPIATQLLRALAMPELGLLHTPADFLCSHGRQCAVVALEDVKAYLTEDSGQIAVSLAYLFPVLVSTLSKLYSPPTPLLPLGSTLVGFHFCSPLIYLVGALPRCLMPPIQLGRGGT